MPSSSRFILLILALLAAGGCASPSARPTGLGEGPAARSQVRIEQSRFDGAPARRVVTDHYVIETTIEDEELASSLGQLMEGALGQYRRLAPDVPLTSKPLECHIFANRTQWAAYTKVNAGDDAKVYLQINRGGYCAGDRYVAYFVGDVGTWSVASHEGLHQYIARHFKRRPPPFLEEGLACLFEDVTWEHDLPRWHWTYNSRRQVGLRNAIAGNAILPLGTLCTMHAGQVVNTGSTRIEAFYSQGWAFARFLWESHGGQYRPGLQSMLRDLAAGQTPAGAEGVGTADGTWEPASARPLLEHYLGRSLEQIDREYQSYCRSIAGQAVEGERPE